MTKKLVVCLNLGLFLMTCFVIVNCNSNKNTNNESGYINEVDTLYELKTNKILSIERTFFRKKPTIHHGLIELKQPKGESYVIFLIKKEGSKEFSLFVIEDFNEFLKNANLLMHNKHLDFFIDVDDLKSTSMRRSMSFEKGIFIRKETNNSAGTILDLSEESVNQMQEAYTKYLNE
ncbi:hypothetical protein [Xanthomarina sp. GH4-25]|uniref:hypothetical protein n=1 Tax=Xanthomarina sp. GH4-25 TaxID=3349335 RepID=UPI000D6843A7|nr:hypothetical protein DI383_01205 [Flavobacteriaceae bacterium LYZ1037]